MEDDGDGRMSETSSIRGGRSSRGRDVMEESEDLSSQMQSMSVRPQLRCNACWEILLSNDQSAQTCYRTTCSHIFCEKCAYKHFGGGRLICPACQTDLSRADHAICETTVHGIVDQKRTEAIWEEMIADPSSCFDHFRRSLGFVLFQLAQDSFRQEQIRRNMEDEHKSFQLQHGEKYIQLKNYADQLEGELREIKAKMDTLKASNEELREAYKEKSRKCRNWEKMCKALKSQTPNRQYLSPARSTSSSITGPRPSANQVNITPQPVSPQFAQVIAHPMRRSYNGASTGGMIRSTMAPQVASTVLTKQRPSMQHFTRPQIAGVIRQPLQNISNSGRTRIQRPKTPLDFSQRMPFTGKRPTFRI